MLASPATTSAADGRTRLALVNAKARLALMIGVAAGIASALVIAIAQAALALPDPLALTGAVSLAALIRPLAFALGALATWFSFRRLVSQDPEHAEIELRIVASRWRWLNRLVFAAITGVLTGWAVALLIEVLGAVVVGAEISRMAAIAATAIGGGLLAGAIAYASADLDRRGLTTRVSAMLVSGLLLSMLTANDPTWWSDSLSHMGQQPDWGWIFNATLILAGLGMLGVTMEIARGLKLLAEAGRFPPRGRALSCDCPGYRRYRLDRRGRLPDLHQSDQHVFPQPELEPDAPGTTHSDAGIALDRPASGEEGASGINCLGSGLPS